MIMPYRYQNKNVLFGSMTAGGSNGREITNGTKGIAKRENYGNGEARGTDDKIGGERVESEL
jgi:hypothetical protein